ncbi:MAG: site-2 protease family protein [Pyrinomonadaceae bacterium]|nr:site-2 protease family protein [Pyrinomonadaceae bacterium]MDQ3135777.1 site-2 protease family protein [Acidobacteriota bacterium]
MDNLNIGNFILYMVALIFSLSVHEAMHAWMSDRFGDDLARHQGRVSINPVTHVDPIGTLLFPAISFFTGAPLLGWARPTPVNPLRWRNKRVANFWVSIAGVIGNFTIAIVVGIVILVLFHASAIGFVPDPRSYVGLVAANPDSPIMEGVAKLLQSFFVMNVGLGVFNLLPIPPLDGSKILSSILPESFTPAIEALEQYGFILLFVAVFTGILGVVFRFVIPLAWNTLLLGVY